MTRYDTLVNALTNARKQLAAEAKQAEQLVEALRLAVSMGLGLSPDSRIVSAEPPRGHNADLNWQLPNGAPFYETSLSLQIVDPANPGPLLYLGFKLRLRPRGNDRFDVDVQESGSPLPITIGDSSSYRAFAEWVLDAAEEKLTIDRGKPLPEGPLPDAN